MALSLLGDAVDLGGSLFGGFGVSEDRRYTTWRGVQVACDPGCECMHPELIYQALLAASPEEISTFKQRWGGTLPGPTGRQYGSETFEQSVARLSFHTGGGRNCGFNEGETWRLNFIKNLISKYNIGGGSSGTVSPTPTSTPESEPSSQTGVVQELENLLRDWIDVPVESVTAGIEEGIRTTRERSAQASTAAGLSDTELLMIVGGIGLVAFLVFK